MKALLAGVLLFCSLAWADESAERKAIENLVSTLNDRALSPQQRAAMFTENATVEPLPSPTMDQISIFSEVTRPFVVTNSVSFLSPKLALVNAAVVQFGSIIVAKGTPLFIAVVKVGDSWRIACLQATVAHAVGVVPA